MLENVATTLLTGAVLGAGALAVKRPTAYRRLYPWLGGIYFFAWTVAMTWGIALLSVKVLIQPYLAEPLQKQVFAAMSRIDVSWSLMAIIIGGGLLATVLYYLPHILGEDDDKG